MEKYDYRSAVSEDIREYLKDHDIVVTPNNINSLEQELYDTLLMEDSVTGNASGSYTFNAWQAAENLCHNWDLLQDTVDEFGDDLGDWIKRGEESCDVFIRCHLMPQCLRKVLDEVEIEIETLQELADYINEAEEIPENVMGIIEANGWEDLTDGYSEICGDGSSKLIFEEGKAVVVAIEEEEQ